MKNTILLLVALVVPSVGPGCTSTEADLCDYKCECEGCSARDYDNCLNDYDRDARDAEFRGCEDFYDEWVACQEATWICRGRDFDTSCGRERDRFKNCID